MYYIFISEKDNMFIKFKDANKLSLGCWEEMKI